VCVCVLVCVVCTRGITYLNFKDHAHPPSHGNDFTRYQTQLLIFVQHSVHRLNPKGVDRPVKDDPLLPFHCVVNSLAEQFAENAVTPLMRRIVEGAVELPHRDGFGVHIELPHLVVFAALFVELGQRISQHVLAHGLPAPRRPHGHKPVPQHRDVIQLNGLGHKGGNALPPCRQAARQSATVAPRVCVSSDAPMQVHAHADARLKTSKGTAKGTPQRHISRDATQQACVRLCVCVRVCAFGACLKAHLSGGGHELFH
jgi:hypothetical protein